MRKSLRLKRSDKTTPPATSHHSHLFSRQNPGWLIVQVDLLQYVTYERLYLQYQYLYPQPPFPSPKTQNPNSRAKFGSRNNPRSSLNLTPATASPKTVSSTSFPFLPLDIHRIEVLQDQLLCRDKSPVGETRIYPLPEPDTCKHACGAEWRPVDYLSLSDAIVLSSSPLK